MATSTLANCFNLHFWLFRCQLNQLGRILSHPDPPLLAAIFHSQTGNNTGADERHHRGKPKLRLPHCLSQRLLLLGRQICQVNSIIAERQFGTCEYEGDFLGCGAVATMTEIESERDYYCLRHFLAISLNAQSIKLGCHEPLRKFDPDVLNSTKGAHS